MPGPGEYRPDPTEGIARIEDLPKPNVSLRSRNYRRQPCPRCGHRAYRDRAARRTLHDRGDTLTGRPRDVVVLYSQPYCIRCRTYFNADMTDLAHPGSHYTRRVVDTASAWSSRTACRTAPPAGACGVTTGCSSPTPRSRTGSRPGGKKAARRTETEHLDWALSDFSGFIAADELDDGPFCIRSLVDNRPFKRLAYQVLSRAPTAQDVEAFFRRFHGALEACGLTVCGVTTDGSALDPEPIAAVFGAVPHQVCTSHTVRTQSRTEAARRRPLRLVPLSTS